MGEGPTNNPGKATELCIDSTRQDNHITSVQYMEGPTSSAGKASELRGLHDLFMPVQHREASI